MQISIILASLVAVALAAPVPEPILSRQESELNAIILAIENDLPAISGAISDVSGLITATEKTLAVLTGTSTTQNGLSGGCKDYTVIFARGTADPGNVGFLVGPPFFDAILAQTSSASFQGVPYSASVTGFLEGGDPAGAPMMAAQVRQAISQCPGSKIIMGGYSQGGQIVHQAATALGSTMGSVTAVVIFGDPDNGTAVDGIDSSKVLIICHDGDLICSQTDIIDLEHLTYAENAAQAASFVLAA